MTTPINVLRILASMYLAPIGVLLLLSLISMKAIEKVAFKKMPFAFTAQEIYFFRCPERAPEGCWVTKPRAVLALIGISIVCYILFP